jgi:hypothetical protein
MRIHCALQLLLRCSVDLHACPQCLAAFTEAALTQGLQQLRESCGCLSQEGLTLLLLSYCFYSYLLDRSLRSISDLRALLHTPVELIGGAEDAKPIANVCVLDIGELAKAAQHQKLRCYVTATVVATSS